MEKSVIMKYQNEDKVKKTIVFAKIKTNHTEDFLATKQPISYLVHKHTNHHRAQETNNKILAV